MSAKSPAKISVLVDRAEFERLERYCRDRGYKKSTLIARLITQYLDLEGFETRDALNRFNRGPGANR